MSRLKWTLLFLFVALGCWAQNGKPALWPLEKILQELERQHQVRFSYLDETVLQKKAEFPNRKLSLPDKIANLEYQTQLEFRFINFYTIAIARAKRLSDVQNDSLITNQLDEVQIDQYLTRGIRKRNNGSFEINPSDFGLLPGLTEADVLQTIQQLPGILSVDGTISNLNIRGGTHDQNLFLWNGIRMYQTGHFFGQISAFNPSIPQQISVYKNGTPAYFGESVSGTISVDTQTPIDTVAKGEISSNLIAIQGYYQRPLWKKAAITVSGRRSLTDLWETPTYNSYSDRVFQNTIVTNLNREEFREFDSRKDFFFYDFSFQFKQQILENQEFLLSGIWIQNQLDIQQKSLDWAPQESRVSQLDQSSKGISASYSMRWNADFKSVLTWTTSLYALDGKNQALESGQQLTQRNRIVDHGFNWYNRLRLANHAILEGGYQYSDLSMENFDGTTLPSFERNEKRIMQTHSLYGQGFWATPDKRFEARGGIRANYYERIGKLRFEPRLQLQYELMPKWKLELLSEWKSQSAAQIIDLQQDFLGLEKRRWMLSNQKEVPLQTSHQTSLGLVYQPKKWLLSAEVYHKTVRHIYSGAQSFQNQLEFTKIIGNYRIYGAEFLIQREFQHWKTYLSYSTSRNRYDFPTYNPAEFFNNFDITHAFSWAALYQTPKYNLALGTKWMTGKPQTSITGAISEQQTIEYKFPNAERLESFFQLNFSGNYSWQLKNSKFSLGLSVLNLLNQTYVIHRYYRLDPTRTEIERVDIHALGRTPNLLLKWSI